MHKKIKDVSEEKKKIEKTRILWPKLRAGAACLAALAAVSCLHPGIYEKAKAQENVFLRTETKAAAIRSNERIQTFSSSSEVPQMLSEKEAENLNNMLWQRTDTETLEKQCYENYVDVGEIVYGLSAAGNSQPQGISGDPGSMVPYIQNGQEAYLYPDGTVTPVLEGFSNSSLYQEYGWYVSCSLNERGGFGRTYFNNHTSLGVTEAAEVSKIDNTSENGMLRVGAKGKMGYIDLEGKVRIPLAFISASPFSEGLAKVMIESPDESGDTKYMSTFINEDGHICAPLFEQASDYENGYAAVSFRLDERLYRGFLDKDGSLKYVFGNVTDTDDLSYISDEGIICIGGVKSAWYTDSKAGREITGGYYLFDTAGNMLGKFDSNYRISAFLPCGLALVQDVSAANSLWESSGELADYYRQLSGTETKLWYMDTLGNQVGEILNMTMEEAEQFLWDGFGININECSQAQEYAEEAAQNISQGQQISPEGKDPESSDGSHLVIGESFIAAVRADGTVAVNGENTYGTMDAAAWTDIESISGEGTTIAGLKKDGTLLLTYSRFPDADTWAGLKDVAMGENFVAGLREDGSVLFSASDVVSESYFDSSVFSAWTNIQEICTKDGVIAGITADNQVKLTDGRTDLSSFVSDWTDIVSVALGNGSSSSIIAGLKKDGTVVITDLFGNSPEGYSVDNWQNITEISVGKDHIAGLMSDGRVVSTGLNLYGECNTESWSDVSEIAAGDGCTAAIKKDGTLLFIGKGINTSAEVEAWTDVVDIAAGDDYSVGVRSDGTILVAGNHPYSGEVKNWDHIVSAEAGISVTAGLKEDGTVVATDRHMEKVADWTDIVELSAADVITGVRSDGTVLDTGLREDENISAWNGSEIVSTAVSGFHVVGLKADGTVLAVGDNDSGECQVSEWTDVTDIAAAWGYTAGLRSDGTLLFAGTPAWGTFSTKEWTNLQKLYANDYYLLGLKTDGSLVLAGSSKIDQEAVRGWKNIVDVAVNDHCILGLREDGTVAAELNGTSSAAAVREWCNLKVRPQ